MKRLLLLVASLAATAPIHAQASHVAEFQVASASYARQRRVWVYTPPGYAPNDGKTYDLLVAFDGGDYTSDIPLPSMLDSLLAAKRIQPTIALLIDDSASVVRLADLANQPRFVTFVADELLPWLRKGWRVTRDPHRTIITGSSAGGLAAAYLALERPELFGNVLSQSGAFWRGAAGSNDPPYEWLTSQYRSAPKRDIRFFMDVGDQETRPTVGVGPSILATNRRLRDVLREKGYALTYTEVQGGEHRPADWKQRLPRGIAELAPVPPRPF